MNVLLILVILLTIFTCFRLMKVFDLAAKLRGKEPYEITESENNINAVLVMLSLVGLFSMFFYLNNNYYDKENMLPIASKHGVEVNNLLHVNFVVISLAFMITQVILMYFAYKYRYNKKRRATHFAHNSKLEIVWTVLPALVLTYLIGKGLIVWNLQMWPKEDPNKITIELYAKQFEWYARYAGEDNTLGEANYTMIDDPVNSLGLITPETIDMQLAKCQEDLARMDSLLQFGFLGKKDYSDMKDAYRRKKFQIQRVIEFKNTLADKDYSSGYDDIVVQQEFHIPVNRTIHLMMRSRDVIHSAYLPHFRVHMYCVPGVDTKFTFEPTVTTAEMRDKTGNPEFNYLLFCNNICGAAHYNMQMVVIVDTEDDYKKWIEEQTTFYASLYPPEEDETPVETDSLTTDSLTDENAVADNIEVE